MPLSSGTRLGPYEVLGPLGAGGMGEVYRARDTRLGRDVAIKLLPAEVAQDAKRLARFRHEAHLLASLNHPHIAAVYGLEEVDGKLLLVLELVEGEDLAERLRRGAIPVDEALAIAKQIAEAVEEAHEKGIVHRDLKPANIKLTPEGKAKVLDFGLAKAYGGEQGTNASAVSHSPTLTGAGTEAGVILGTAAYMSPEQARGKTVDKRADIWAFGVVLFEMLTATRLFAGESVGGTLELIFSREPDLATLPAGTPARVRTLIARCLLKDARQRLRDIGEARLALEGAFETAAPQTTPSAVAPAPRGRLAWIALAVAAVLGIVGLAIPAVRYLRETPPAETRVDIVTPVTDSPASFALSPDGRQIVFVASGDGASRLWLRSLATTTPQPLTGTEGARLPFWAPDSRSIGFFAGTALKRLDLGGGTPQTLARVVAGSGGTWNADGVILFAPSTANPLSRVPASGGPPVAVTTLDRQLSHRLPFFLPDGRQFLFYGLGTPDTAGIYLGALDSPDTHRVTAADAAGVYLSSGWLLWVGEGKLVAQRLDLDRRVLTGDALTLADPVVVDPGSSLAAVSVSAGGLVAYRAGGASGRQLAWFDRSGTALGPLGAPDKSNLLAPSVSPDGHRVAVSRAVQGNTDLWLLDGTRTSRFTFDAGLDLFPIWSPDGRRIVFNSNRKRHYDLYRKYSSGAGAEDLLVESAQTKVATDWSADGKFLLYYRVDPQTDRDLWVLPMEGDRTPWVFLQTPFDERYGTFSPDGRWVAYESNESGRMEIYVRPFAGPAASGGGVNTAGGQWQVSTAGGVFPRWRRDGKEIYYLGPSGAMMAASITVTGATLAPEAPVLLFPTRIAFGGVDDAQGRQYDVTRDGRFLINTVLGDGAAPITLLQNWDPEAKK